MIRSSKEWIKRHPTAEESTHWLLHGIAFALLPLGIAYVRKRSSAREEGQLPRRQLAQYTEEALRRRQNLLRVEEAEPPPCPGQASLFFSTKVTHLWRFWHQHGRF